MKGFHSSLPFFFLLSSLLSGSFVMTGPFFSVGFRPFRIFLYCPGETLVGRLFFSR